MSLHEEHHDLQHHFPEYSEKIESLINTDNNFRKLFEKYNELDEQIRLIEQNVDARTDIETEELKKHRLAVKDEIYGILTQSSEA